MPTLSVWAPKVNNVELIVAEKKLPMSKDLRGFWHSDDAGIADGIDYAFLLDGQGPFPDPRSPCQPYGVEAPSRYVDHSKFSWQDAGFRAAPFDSAVFYEVHVGTFSSDGSFDGLIAHLDHLVKLGITHIELMPVAEFAGRRGWGYDGVALYAPHHCYGGPDGLKRLVNACHCKGIAVVLDVVYNHLGPVGNYLSRFGPYFSSSHATPWGEGINMDGAESHEVRRFFIDNALMWLEHYHLDGLRIDAIHAIEDRSKMHFLEQLASEVLLLENRVGHPLLLIAENDLNDVHPINPKEMGGYGLHAQWNEDFHHALHAYLTKESQRYYQDFGKLEDLVKAMTQGFVYDGCYSRFRNKKHGRPARGIIAHQLIGFCQNHDQVGNRAFGERTSQLLSFKELKVAAALLLLGPFTPLLFQGEEWGASTPFLFFTDYEDGALGEAVYEGRKKEFSDFCLLHGKIPHPQDEESFLSSKLCWNELMVGEHQALFLWYRDLIRLRRQESAFKDPNLAHLHVAFSEEDRWLRMERGPFVVLFNFNEKWQKIPCAVSAAPKSLLSSDEGCKQCKDGYLLPGQTVAVFTNDSYIKEI